MNLATTLAPGIWRVESYPSGTIVVSSGKSASTKYGIRGVGPHVGIHYAKGRKTKDSERYELAETIAAALNIGTGIDAARLTETSGVYRGVEFSAIGPHVDKNPPNCFWVEDDSEAGKNTRARLMDAVFGI